MERNTIRSVVKWRVRMAFSWTKDGTIFIGDTDANRVRVIHESP